jgi:hypothetical protein
MTICIVVVLGFCSRIFAQAGIDQGSITGTVKDPSGALVVRATCTLTNPATGISQTTVTTSAGAYAFPLVNVGTYSLKVEAKGFEDYLLTGIVVHVGTTDTEDVSLKVGTANASVSVTSAAPLLQAQDASLGMTIDNSMATELPLFGGSGGRNFVALATIAPGVQFSGSNLTASTGSIIANGTPSISIDVRLNGVDDNVEVFGGVTIPPIPDAIQEFKLEDGNNSADLGEFYGPVVNVVTVVGTNKFHGKAWEYNENDAFNANDYFNKLHELVTNATHTPNRPGRYKENSYGGLFSGPVRLPGYNGRDKTFFTVDYQRTNYSAINQYTETVPTSLMQSSGFTNLSDTLKLNYQAAGGTGNPLNSEKQDAEGRYFQVGMMLDPATTRAIPCGSVDPITGLVATCSAGYVVTNSVINGGVKSGVVRDPFLSGAGGCPSLVGTTNFNSTYNTGNGSQPTSPANCFNQLSASRLDPNAVALLKLFPGANQQNASNLTYSNNYYNPVPQPTVTTQYDIRIDHKIRDKDSLLGTFSHWAQSSPGAAPLPGILEGGTSGSAFAYTIGSYILMATETHTFNPSLVNQFRFGNERQIQHNNDPGYANTILGIPAQYGIQGIPQTGQDSLANGGLPDFSINSGISGFGSRANITYRTVGAWLYSDDLTKIEGRHELKVGGEWLWTYGNIAQLPYSRGSFGYGGFSNVPNSGDNNPSMADFLLVPEGSTIGASGLSQPGNIIGGASSFTGSNPHLSTYHAPYLAFYGIDNWKITPNLTANLSLRYEYFGPYFSDGGEEANLWMGGNGNTANGTAYYVGHDGCATTMSPFFRGLLAYDNIPIICQSNNAANKTPKANWGPRIGFSYRIRPNLVVRMGAGVAYGGFDSVGYGDTLGTNYPFQFTAQQSGNANAYTPNVLGANNVPATMESTFANIDLTNPTYAYMTAGSVALYGKQYNFKEPRITTLTAAVQWQFTNHDSIQASYVGNLGQNLETLQTSNNVPNELLTPNTQQQSTSCANASNPYCATGYIPFPNLHAQGGIETTGQVMNYESGVAEYQHQFAAGFNMNVNYTFTRCLTDAQGGQQNESSGASRAPWVAGYRYDYNRCANEADNVFKMSGEFNLPFGRGGYVAAHDNALEDAVIGGWKIDPIWMAFSGVTSSVACGGANGYTGAGAPSGTFTGPWFGGSDFQCFAPPIPGQHLYGPGPNDKPRTRLTGYLNSAAWTAPGPVTTNGQTDLSPLGVRGNQISGPGWYDVDFDLHKQFNTGEGTKLEFGVQALNAFNHVQLNNPGTGGYTNPSAESITGGFGTITGDRLGNGEGRILQFDGKFSF